MKFSSDLIRGVAEPIVLRLVAERPMYGYEIIKDVNQRTNQAFEWKEGTLYPCLHRLEAAKLVDSEWREATSGKQRKYYRITRKGRAFLRDKVSEWTSFSAAVSALLLCSHEA